MTQNRRPGWRFWLWLLALGMLATALFKPTWTLPQRLPRYLVVVDITQSMNVRDYHLPDLPPDRLSFAKAALEHAILALPCGSEAGIGIFTHKNSQLLLEPLEVCRHGSALRAALRAIDWRSAWAGDSHIAYGLYDALRTARTLRADLVFVTDGDQIPATREPRFAGRFGQVGGWLVGAGTPRPAPIPKLDQDNRMTGYWQTSDLPRPAQSARYHPHMPRLEAGLLLSRLDEARLKTLADATGLAYLRLSTPGQLAGALGRQDSGLIRPKELDLRPWIGLGALIAIVVTVLV